MSSNSKLNLLNYNRAAMSELFVSLGEPAYRATQVLKWLHQVGVHNIDAMSNLSKKLREKLIEISEIKPLEIATEQISNDGTRKWLMRLADGNCVEAVFIPEDDRGTLCVSSQVGCALTCSFCSTAKQGFSRNLEVSEIIGQVWLAVRRLSQADGAHDRRVTNVVMMGMGEPLLNFDNVVAAMDLMMDDFAYGLSKRRVTLSTSGVVPMMHHLKEISDVALAVSLHAPNNALRDILVPINKKYPLEELMAVCRSYFKEDGKRRITFEYVMLHEVNDSPEHAKELIQLLNGMNCMVNLIPFNRFPDTIYKRSSQNRIKQFHHLLEEAGITCITRKTRGDDIDAACGQLVGKVQDRTSRSRLEKQKVQSLNS